MHRSGLLDQADQINFCINGNLGAMMPILWPLVASDPDRMRLIQVHTDASKFEYPTLARLKLDADQSTTDDQIGYAHLKGLSTGSQQSTDWRQYLTHFTINCWRDNVQALSQGYSTSGVNWSDTPWPHHSGNFWWATAAHVRGLPSVPDPDQVQHGTLSKYLTGIVLDPGNFRFEHEAWIGYSKPHYMELHASPGKLDHDWHYSNEYPAHHYKNKKL
jgi:hypothetical protein